MMLPPPTPGRHPPWLRWLGEFRNPSWPATLSSALLGPLDAGWWSQEGGPGMIVWSEEPGIQGLPKLSTVPGVLNAGGGGITWSPPTPEENWTSNASERLPWEFEFAGAPALPAWWSPPPCAGPEDGFGSLGGKFVGPAVVREAAREGYIIVLEGTPPIGTVVLCAPPSPPYGMGPP